MEVLINILCAVFFVIAVVQSLRANWLKIDIDILNNKVHFRNKLIEHHIERAEQRNRNIKKQEKYIEVLKNTIETNIIEKEYDRRVIKIHKQIQEAQEAKIIKKDKEIESLKQQIEKKEKSNKLLKIMIEGLLNIKNTK